MSIYSRGKNDLQIVCRGQFIFVHDNVPSHATKVTSSFLTSLGMKDETLMTWPPCFPDLKLIEQLLSILKREAYEGEEENSSFTCILPF